MPAARKSSWYQTERPAHAHQPHRGSVSVGLRLTVELLLAAETAICLRWRRPGFDRWVRKIPWGRKGQYTPIFLPGEFHGQRNLMGYSPWGCKESDTTERLDNNKGMEKLKTQRSCFSKVAQPARNLGLVETSLMPSPGSLSTWPLSLADL